jgi:4-diphosphocytidyl-2-C-methyl-D-erythritol kinase
MQIAFKSPAKINLFLNILGKRNDGFHELETIIQPIGVFDEISLTVEGSGISLECDTPAVPTDATNLAFKAAESFFSAIEESPRCHIKLKKRIPAEAGLGGGSGNAATTLTALNNAFKEPLSAERLHELASALGSDVPSFLSQEPVKATGRGEILKHLPEFQALKGLSVLLVRPGFGISTAWAYKNLANFPSALNGTKGRISQALSEFSSGSTSSLTSVIYNSLEAPVIHKYPWIQVAKEFLITNGALASMMSGSGSTIFSLCSNQNDAVRLGEQFSQEFGSDCWTAIAPIL